MRGLNPGFQPLLYDPETCGPPGKFILSRVPRPDTQRTGSGNGVTHWQVHLVNSRGMSSLRGGFHKDSTGRQGEPDDPRFTQEETGPSERSMASFSLGGQSKGWASPLSSHGLTCVCRQPPVGSLNFTHRCSTSLHTARTVWGSGVTGRARPFWTKGRVGRCETRAKAVGTTRTGVSPSEN